MRMIKYKFVFSSSFSLESWRFCLIFLYLLIVRFFFLRSTTFVGPIEEFTTERRGIWYHQHDGYYYRKYQKHRPKFYLECIQQKCNVTGNLMTVSRNIINVAKWFCLLSINYSISAVMNENLSGSIFIANNRTHNHPPDKDMKTVVLARKAILSRCRSEDTPLKKIYDSEMAKYETLQFCLYWNS